jgi:hypothetical protein
MYLLAQPPEAWTQLGGNIHVCVYTHICIYASEAARASAFEQLLLECIALLQPWSVIGPAGNCLKWLARIAYKFSCRRALR